MSEYISREEVYQKLHDAGGCGATDEWSKGYDEAIGVAINIIEDASSADVAPVVHGYWKPVKGGNVACSKCGHLEPPQHDHYNFCANCSAKMDESEESGNERT